MHWNLKKSIKYWFFFFFKHTFLGYETNIALSDAQRELQTWFLIDFKTAGGWPQDTWAAATLADTMFVCDEQNFLKGVSAWVGLNQRLVQPPPLPFQSNFNFSCWKIMFKNMNSHSGSWSLGWKISVETAAGVFSVGVQWCRRADVHIWWHHERGMFEEEKVRRAHSTLGRKNLNKKKKSSPPLFNLTAWMWKVETKPEDANGGRSNTSHLIPVRWRKSGRASSEIPTLLVGKMSGLNRLSLVFLLNHFKDLNR